jgi:type II secretory pathway pseudopilin PulG
MSGKKNMKLKLKNKNENGFTLIEATAATAILLVVLLGAASVFTYSTIYNTGSNIRSQALSVLQREIETIRIAKFTPSVTDETLTGGEKAPKYVTAADGTSFKVVNVVDDDPFTAGTQVDSTKTLKEISITITPTNKVASWQTAVGTEVIIRRVRGN